MKKKLYKLKLDDGGRNFSKRIGQSADCTVRTLAILSKHDYDEVYDLLAKSGRKPCRGFYIGRWLKYRIGRKILGGYFSPMKEKNVTASTFSQMFPKGKYALETHDHIYAVIDGVAHDLLRMKADEPILGIWIFTK